MEAALAYQRKILPAVSRTFALTIPQLPPGLRDVVGNAYLLCRLADTIEDDPGLPATDKNELLQRFVAVVHGQGDAGALAKDLGNSLSAACSPAERELAAQLPVVLRVTVALPQRQLKAVQRCVSTMCEGMPAFQRRKSLDGLPTLADMDRYCYYVAGVVGEMLTELFCDYCPELEAQRQRMLQMAACFGQGLQMTNILKDVWEDRDAGSCWLPRSYFQAIDGGLGRVLRERDRQALGNGLEQLVPVAHAHLAAALEYTCLIPSREPGIRRFCLWAIIMAVLTLRKINANPAFHSGDDVKISRRTVRLVILASNLAVPSNLAMRLLFRFAGRGLPAAQLASVYRPAGDRVTDARSA